MKQRADHRFTKTKRVEGKKIFGYGKTPEEAEEDLQRKLNPVHLSKLQPDTARLLDVCEECWYPHLEGLAPLTKKRYLGTYGKHIMETLEMVPLTEINALRLKDWLRKLERKGETANTRAYALDVLSGILKHAVNLELIPSNPCNRVSVKVVKQKRVRTLPVEDALKMLDMVRDTPIGLPCYLASVLWLRRGEIAALKWDALDRQKKTLEIKYQRQAIRPLGVVERPCKQDSMRTLYLPEEVIRVIDEMGNIDSSYITTYNGLPWVPDTITEFWGGVKSKDPERCKVGIRETVGLPDWHFHDLRHLAAGLLAAAGCSILVIQAVLGHKSPDMSLIYTDVDDERKREAADAMSLILCRQRS